MKEPAVSMQFPCKACAGEGFVKWLDTDGKITCTLCRGTGYDQRDVPLSEFAKMLTDHMQTGVSSVRMPGGFTL